MKLKKFEWDTGKNQLVKETRNVCFEDVEQAILDGDVYQVIPHHNADKNWVGNNFPELIVGAILIALGE